MAWCVCVCNHSVTRFLVLFVFYFLYFFFRNRRGHGAISIYLLPPPPPSLLLTFGDELVERLRHAVDEMGNVKGGRRWQVGGIVYVQRVPHERSNPVGFLVPFSLIFPNWPISNSTHNTANDVSGPHHHDNNNNNNRPST